MGFEWRLFFEAFVMLDSSARLSRFLAQPDYGYTPERRRSMVDCAGAVSPTLVRGRGGGRLEIGRRLETCRTAEQSGPAGPCGTVGNLSYRIKPLVDSFASSKIAYCVAGSS